MCSRVDKRVQPVAVSLDAVEGVVLNRRDHVLALYPVDRLSSEHGTQ